MLDAFYSDFTMTPTKKKCNENDIMLTEIMMTDAININRNVFQNMIDRGKKKVKKSGSKPRPLL